MGNNVITKFLYNHDVKNMPPVMMTSLPISTFVYLHLCIYICVSCISTFLYTYISVSTFVYIHVSTFLHFVYIYICVSPLVYLHLCILYIYISVYLHQCIYICVYPRLYLFTFCVYLHLYIYIYISTSIYLHLYIYIYISTFVYTYLYIFISYSFSRYTLLATSKGHMSGKRGGVKIYIFLKSIYLTLSSGKISAHSDNFEFWLLIWTQSKMRGCGTGAGSMTSSKVVPLVC